MLAERLPGLLPPLDDEAALEVTAVHSVAGTLGRGGGAGRTPLLTAPPFQAPHHTASVPAIVGGGSTHVRPGAASLAHRGVLFLDEAPEFAPGVLDALREPLESGEITVARLAAQVRFPARFQLVLAANPCPCGLAADRGSECSCTPMARIRYLGRLSGPLLDRVDLRIEMLAASRADLRGDPAGAEGTAAVADRVRAARDRMAARLAGTPWRVNAEVPGHVLRREWRLPWDVVAEAERLLDLGPADRPRCRPGGPGRLDARRPGGPGPAGRRRRPGGARLPRLGAEGGVNGAGGPEGGGHRGRRRRDRARERARRGRAGPGGAEPARRAGRRGARRAGRAAGRRGGARQGPRRQPAGSGRPTATGRGWTGWTSTPTWRSPPRPGRGWCCPTGRAGRRSSTTSARRGRCCCGSAAATTWPPCPAGRSRWWGPARARPTGRRSPASWRPGSATAAGPSCRAARSGSTRRRTAERWRSAA